MFLIPYPCLLDSIHSQEVRALPDDPSSTQLAQLTEKLGPPYDDHGHSAAAMVQPPPPPPIPPLPRGASAADVKKWKAKKKRQEERKSVAEGECVLPADARRPWLGTSFAVEAWRRRGAGHIVGIVRRHPFKFHADCARHMMTSSLVNIRGWVNLAVPGCKDGHLRCEPWETASKDHRRRTDERQGAACGGTKLPRNESGEIVCLCDSLDNGRCAAMRRCTSAHSKVSRVS